MVLLLLFSLSKTRNKTDSYKQFYTWEDSYDDSHNKFIVFIFQKKFEKILISSKDNGVQQVI